MNPTDVKSIIDTASSQSDRWLFIALLVIGLIVVWGLFRYFTAELAKVTTQLNELNKFVRDEQSDVIGKCTAALEHNSRPLEKMKSLKLSQTRI